MISNPSHSEEHWMPQSLRDRLGSWRQDRCLSSRDFREVHLVEDSQGAWRIFKISRQRDADSLVRFQQVRETLKGITPETGLIPVLDYGLEPVHGMGWEELPLADSVDSGSVDFAHYTPVTPVVGRDITSSGSVKIALSVLQALEFLHRQGWVHGDVKPANLLQLQGRWLLGDYDTVGVVGAEGVVTASTEGYCPPGGGNTPERDLFALGKLIYELWSGNSRLEYPSLPPRLTRVATWSREDRLINRLVEALCHPVGLNRLRQLAGVRMVLESLESGDVARLDRAEALLEPRKYRVWKRVALGAAVLGFLSGVLLQSNWLPRVPLIKAGAALFAEVPDREPTQGLAGYYPLDGDSQDHSGRGHHGTAFKVSWVADASKTPARAARFNGEAGISIPEFPESEAGQHSLVLWMRSSQTNEGKLLIKDRSVGDRDSPGRQWLLGLNNQVAGGGVWALPEGSTNQQRSVLGIMKSGPGYWTHLVQTWDGRTLELWIDGERVDSILAAGSLAPGDSPVRIGWDQYYFFQGDIDEVRLYDRALSNDEVQGLFRLGLRKAVRQWWASMVSGG
ncbi:MAG: hypothetical protein RLZZ582_2489 [Verrucomicrobiota bacterium]|jgi:hypothetical protein